MKYSYKPTGICAREILFEIEGDIVTDVQFVGGCAGNTQGVSALSKGKSVDELIAVLSDINCGNKGTSCPDQLARALKETKNA